MEDDELGSYFEGSRWYRREVSIETDDEPAQAIMSMVDESEAEAPPPSQLLMPGILSRSLTATKTKGHDYNPRSDRHSVLKCWGFLLDLLRVSPLLAQHMQQRRVCWGINSTVGGKDLDLVIGEPAGAPRPWRLGEVVRHSGISLTAEERGALAPFWSLCEGDVVRPYLAVEAKAVMTDHSKALSRLSDELGMFPQRLQGGLSVGLLLINTARSFTSPGKNRSTPSATPVISQHRDDVVDAVFGKLRGLTGFDGLGALCLDCPNDGTGVRLADHHTPPEFSYEALVTRMVQLYSERFA